MPNFKVAACGAADGMAGIAASTDMEGTTVTAGNVVAEEKHTRVFLRVRPVKDSELSLKVYDEVSRPAVHSLMKEQWPPDSDSKTIVAKMLVVYGTTNAGKTFTVLGSAADPGILPRALKDIFELAPSDATITMRCTEVYKNKVRDLLDIQNATADKKLLAPAQNGGCEEIINSAADGIEVIKNAQERRQTHNNGINETSSRSHLLIVVSATLNGPTEMLLRYDFVGDVDYPYAMWILSVPVSGTLELERQSATCIASDMPSRKYKHYHRYGDGHSLCSWTNGNRTWRAEANDINLDNTDFWGCTRIAQKRFKSAAAGARPYDLVIVGAASPASAAYGETEQVLQHTSEAFKLGVNASIAGAPKRKLDSRCDMNGRSTVKRPRADAQMRRQPHALDSSFLNVGPDEDDASNSFDGMGSMQTESMATLRRRVKEAVKAAEEANRRHVEELQQRNAQHQLEAEETNRRHVAELQQRDAQHQLEAEEANRRHVKELQQRDARHRLEMVLDTEALRQQVEQLKQQPTSSDTPLSVSATIKLIEASLSLATTWDDGGKLAAVGDSNSCAAPTASAL
ncbi:P-loop containing nucleoside triphosphate hydrolase protein [Tribonema minus]|uniref:P-loop containing nucleoside triphosphate hydrolase protein n=1 Tax=Tribonema minus TaxID=303371 RepID=A0A835YUL2_9STRA|nr:P-loop containing nucleoside triphosphate hydrolase protein [Tribonema minus]